MVLHFRMKLSLSPCKTNGKLHLWPGVFVCVLIHFCGSLNTRVKVRQICEIPRGIRPDSQTFLSLFRSVISLSCRDRSLFRGDVWLNRFSADHQHSCTNVPPWKGVIWKAVVLHGLIFFESWLESAVHFFFLFFIFY